MQRPRLVATQSCFLQMATAVGCGWEECETSGLRPSGPCSAGSVTFCGALFLKGGEVQDGNQKSKDLTLQSLVLPFQTGQGGRRLGGFC